MNAAELRELDSEELVLQMSELKEELFNLRFQLATGQLDNTRRVAQVKREVARIKTVLRERELEAWEEQLSRKKAKVERPRPVADVGSAGEAPDDEEGAE